jgi:hypothetical protein
MFRYATSVFVLGIASLVAVGCGGSTDSDAGPGNDAPGGGGGTFTCGTSMCTTASQYCEESISTATGSLVSTYSCLAIPASCSGTDFCMSACFTGMTGFQGCGVSDIGMGKEYNVRIMR